MPVTNFAGRKSPINNISLGGREFHIDNEHHWTGRLRRCLVLEVV
jgi:hypothetical protein